ncbi:M48 family metalloprotease [Pseudomonas sp. N040]|uniref:M48 family metalloprotease n=1 Tax=Pseudomonas sp. N040 TaxID=2785325 RepID=UPI0018A2E247|nr:M48 family metalloprotease [Pseudomonas sp. N040]MBF7729348.1 M48 family metallopeptidase [Pseudomonas sp. N040]MBW7012988.1 M48 family metalloprotease [Pseudomonas sp. N040]
MHRLRPALLCVACLIAAPAIGDDLPSFGDSSSGIVSQQEERELGHAYLSIIRGQTAQIPDPLLKDYLENNVYRLAESSQVQDRRFNFILLKSRQLNAFAAPGGIIGVNGGLFLYAQTEGEFSSVLAHELAHLSQRHFARGVEAQQQMQIPVMAAMLGGIIAMAAGAGDAGIAAIASTQAAAMQAQQRFSRQNEQEADRIGMQTLENAGYDPRSMPDMFGRLMSQYRYDSRPPEFLMSHPVTESRIADTRNRAEQFPDGGVKDTTRYQLMRTRIQLVFEETPGLAAKRFQAMLADEPGADPARYGLAIAQIQGGQLKLAGENLKPLLDKAPNEIVYNLAQVELDLTAKRLGEARARIEKLLKSFPNNYPVLQALTDLQVKEGKSAQAEKTLDQLVSLRPYDPDIWYQVAEVRGQTGNIIGLHQARAEFFALVGDYPQAIEQLNFAKRRAAANFPLASRIDTRQQQLMAEQAIIQQMMR